MKRLDVRSTQPGGRLTMLRASWKSLLGRKLRLFMSAFAIILGVSFVSGSFIFTDTLSKAFDGIVNTVGEVVVRPDTASSGFDSGPTAKTVPGSLVSTLAGLPGVARADGNVTDPTTFVVSKKGKLIGGGGPPGLGLAWNDAPTTTGEPPATIAAGQVAAAVGRGRPRLRHRQAGGLLGRRHGHPRHQRRPAEGDAPPSSGWPSSRAGRSARRWPSSTPGPPSSSTSSGKDEYSDVWVTGKDGTSAEDLAAAVQASLPKGFEAVTGKSVAKEQATGINQALSFINIFLLVFAGIALFVGSFLIINTFSILVAQRSRELAMLRALGAGRRQVTRSVLFEAFVVGLVGSTVGLGAGLPARPGHPGAVRPVRARPQRFAAGLPAAAPP